jgi:hypothetical protein
VKVYIISEGRINTGHPCQIRCIVKDDGLAEKICDSFKWLGLSITEFEVIDAWTHDQNGNLSVK